MLYCSSPTRIHQLSVPILELLDRINEREKFIPDLDTVVAQIEIDSKDKNGRIDIER